MANTYTWSITGLFCYPQSEGQTNVVFNTQWNVSATDGTNNASISGSQPLTYTAGNPFTDYSSLTKEQVIGWVQSAMGAEQVASIQSSLDNQLANLANPPIVTNKLPWETT
jgi:urease alpha subunit